MKRNIAYKADGTEETGKKIIDALMALGGNNEFGHEGIAPEYYFFIANDGIIDLDKKIPFCYELKSLNQIVSYPEECQDYIENFKENLISQIKEIFEKL